ncbi:MAG: PilZ domain-containing protein [Actinomycetota bacterium]|jgi:hypothetical protein|nr:PilZ domain-containing protein [Actinomycetota bacterium]
MIEVGTRLSLRPTYGDEVEAVGRVVSMTPGSLEVRVGRHPWLQPGAHLTCTAQQGSLLAHFTTFIDEVAPNRGFTIRIARPATVADANRRSEPRLETRNPLVWSLIDDGQLTGCKHQGLTVDMSAGGLSFETADTPPPVGAMVAVALDLPIGNMVTLGTITGIDDSTSVHFADRHHVRISSVAIPEDQRRDFQRWIADELTATLATARGS